MSEWSGIPPRQPGIYMYRESPYAKPVVVTIKVGQDGRLYQNKWAVRSYVAETCGRCQWRGPLTTPYDQH